ncbi:hypothetical protein [uncultured Granulicatella sp.]|uniref:hypothetical protein n=1 Tax=uncultured Granulicatella sp. TaxID=316089 RepID=UPI0028D33C14|nr:hypothetical protein [uncultured Granulicatella sp.]
MGTPVLNFKGYRIVNIDYKRLESTEEFDSESKDFMDLSAFVGITEDNNEAHIKVTCLLNDIENLRKVTIEIVGIFEMALKDASEEEIKKILAVNGVAILFPYVRAAMSVISSLDNENSILLPTINTTSFHEVDR